MGRFVSVHLSSSLLSPISRPSKSENLTYHYYSFFVTVSYIYRCHFIPKYHVMALGSLVSYVALNDIGI